MQYLRILVSQNSYAKCIEVLKTEIDFLRSSEKNKYDGTGLYIMDLMLIYMIMHNGKEVDASEELLNSEEFVNSREREVFENLYVYFQNGDQEGWLKYLNSSKIYPILPQNVS